MAKFKIFKFYADPGHGWLAVKVKDSESVGLTADDYSSFSFKRGKTFYLEEDSDAGLFVRAWKAKTGWIQDGNIKYSHTDKRHPIRSYESINQNWRQNNG